MPARSSGGFGLQPGITGTSNASTSNFLIVAHTTNDLRGERIRQWDISRWSTKPGETNVLRFPAETGSGAGNERIVVPPASR